MTIYTVSTNFTRPSDTTAYAASDLIANSTTAGSVTPMTFFIPYQGFELTNVQLLHTAVTTTLAKFYLHLYTNSPTVDNGDNGAFVSSQSGYLGRAFIDCSQQAFSSSGSGGTGMGIVNPDVLPIVVDASLNVYGLLQANSAYTPSASEVFTITLIGNYDS